MRLNSALIRLIPIGLFVLLFPFVQKQWFNLSLLNPNNNSFYSVLYYLSGFTCPLIISYYSFRDFTYYKFNKVNNINIFKQIKGNTLLITIAFILIPLSILSINYLYINLDLVLKYFFNISYFQKISFLHNLFFTLGFCILFIFRNTRIFIKKLTLFNFIIVSFIIWNSNINSFFDRGELLVNGYLSNSYSNILNIVFLFTFELLYYFWSYISYKDNLSNWMVPLPTKKNVEPISKVVVFFLLIIVYYSILD